MSETKGKEVKKGHLNLILTLILIVLLVFCWVVGEKLPEEAAAAQETVEATMNASVSSSQPKTTVSASAAPALETTKPVETPRSYAELSGILAAVKSAISEENEIRTSSLYAPDDEIYDQLLNEIRTLHDNGHQIGLMMVDLNSGEYLSYNADQNFYSASSIKAFYIAAVASSSPEAVSNDSQSMQKAVMYSDNDAYMYLHKKYHYDVMHAWCDKAQVPDDVWNVMYPDYSARDVCQLWCENYYWFKDDAEGQKDAWWYESPNMSNIRKIVDENTVTRTKAGWIAENYYEDGTGVTRFLSATNEGGIVYDGEHPFIIAVMSDVPSDFAQIYDVEKTLLDAHDEMIQQIYGD